jgi:hypothetical protein
MDGTYRFVYSGEVNVGIGVFVIKDNVIKGADLFGTRYRGQIAKDPETGCLSVLLDMLVPAGTSLVQGSSFQELDRTKTEITLLLRPDFDNGKPIEVFISPGYVTLMIKRTLDAESIYADGFSLTATPKSPSPQ